MRKKTSVLLILLIISNDIVYGKHKNRTKLQKTANRKINEPTNRDKRSLSENSATNIAQTHSDNDGLVHPDQNKRMYYGKMEEDPPFWGNRGRRESSELIDNNKLPFNRQEGTRGFKLMPRFDFKQDIDGEDSPFWGNRGRRDSGESEEKNYNSNIDWGERERRQDDEPFWGTRGRREDFPFWGNRGRRENYLLRSDDNSPFWGNRGRREESEPFWGNRGRRETIEPFWGSRGKKKENKIHDTKDENNLFWENFGRQKSDIILEAIKSARDMEFERHRRRGNQYSFWNNRGRDSKMRYLFSGPAYNRMRYNTVTVAKDANREVILEPPQHNTVGDDRIFAEEPHYILVERSSRSSAENDPFIITRGKKYSNFDVAKAVRDRRGALEEIVKSVRNDPYYIARGKKDLDYIVFGNNATLHDELLKAKELVCATVDLLMMKHQDNKVKRDMGSNERDRRTILKKIALQLQMDPYYVSRGKKDSGIDEETLEKFVNHVLRMCLELNN